MTDASARRRPLAPPGPTPQNTQAAFSTGRQAQHNDQATMDAFTVSSGMGGSDDVPRTTSSPSPEPATSRRSIATRERTSSISSPTDRIAEHDDNLSESRDLAPHGVGHHCADGSNNSGTPGHDEKSYVQRFAETMSQQTYPLSPQIQQRLEISEFCTHAAEMLKQQRAQESLPSETDLHRNIGNVFAKEKATKLKAVEVEDCGAIDCQGIQRRFRLGSRFFLSPENGKEYTKYEALAKIHPTTKYSQERAAMIRFMVQKGYVPCTAKTVYKFVHQVEEEGLTVGYYDEWSGQRGRPTKSSVARRKRLSSWWGKRETFRRGKTLAQYLRPEKRVLDWSHDNARKNLQGREAWKGSIKFNWLVPIKAGDDLDHLFQLQEPNQELGYHDPWRWYPNLRQRLFEVDICSYMGRRWSWEKGIHRLYFSPTTYPPPKQSTDTSGNCMVFNKLRGMIREASRKDGSPVFCNGGVNEKVFICEANGRTHNDNWCPFRFTLRWDEYGYYINLMTKDKEKVVCNGCPFHLCD